MGDNQGVAMTHEMNHLYLEDCMEGMKDIPDKFFDMIICDLPYGTTACKWDTIIPFEPLWEQYKRIIKDNGAIVLTASQPFTSALVMSNVKMFKYEWVWEKTIASNFMLSKKQPQKKHENILVFYKEQPNINLQMEVGKPYKDSVRKRTVGIHNQETIKKAIENIGTRYPSSVQKINSISEGLHPTQKPVALFEYLIKTYTNEGELVLDNCMGSGTTAIACMKTGRNYIGFELDPDYHKAAQERIDSYASQMRMEIL
jgi:site-specific DNA-methyltransferase (adenine-specific)